jgi:transposase
MQPSSARINMRRAQKGGAEDEAIGRSRGGLSTKIHALVDALGNPLRFILTPGQAHESKQAECLIAGFHFDKLLADKGYDSDHFRAVIAAAGAEAVVPPIGSRKAAIPLRRDPLQGAQSGRALLQQDQAFPPHRHTLR